MKGTLTTIDQILRYLLKCFVVSHYLLVLRFKPGQRSAGPTALPYTCLAPTGDSIMGFSSGRMTA